MSPSVGAGAKREILRRDGAGRSRTHGRTSRADAGKVAGVCCEISGTKIFSSASFFS